MSSVNSDIAYDHIRRKILSGALAPGQPLMTMALAEEIGVSRTPVRDALRQLEADGLVTIKPRLGASVTEMSMKEFREICTLRLALESFAAGLAATERREDDLQDIRYALDEMGRIVDSIRESAEADRRQLADLAKEDVRFHVAIMSASRNELMKKEILRLHLINRVIAGPAPSTPVSEVEDKDAQDARRQEVQDCHRRIFDAIEARDAATAKAQMEYHIQDIIHHNLRRLAREQARSAARELTEEELIYTP